MREWLMGGHAHRTRGAAVVRPAGAGAPRRAASALPPASRPASPSCTRASRTGVGVEQAGPGAALQHRRQLPGQVVGVAHAGVHAKRACRGWARFAARARGRAAGLSVLEQLTHARVGAQDKLQAGAPANQRLALGVPGLQAAPRPRLPRTHPREGRRARRRPLGTPGPRGRCAPRGPPSSTAAPCAPASRRAGRQGRAGQHLVQHWHAPRRPCRHMRLLPQPHTPPSLHPCTSPSTHLQLQVAALCHLAHNLGAARRRELRARLQRREVGHLRCGVLRGGRRTGELASRGSAAQHGAGSRGQGLGPGRSDQNPARPRTPRPPPGPRLGARRQPRRRTCATNSPSPMLWATTTAMACRLNTKYSMPSRPRSSRPSCRRAECGRGRRGDAAAARAVLRLTQRAQPRHAVLPRQAACTPPLPTSPPARPPAARRSGC